jgi:hypothetical protein
LDQQAAEKGFGAFAGTLYERAEQGARAFGLSSLTEAILRTLAGSPRSFSAAC